MSSPFSIKFNFHKNTDTMVLKGTKRRLSADCWMQGKTVLTGKYGCAQDSMEQRAETWGGGIYRQDARIAKKDVPYYVWFEAKNLAPWRFQDFGSCLSRVSGPVRVRLIQDSGKKRTRRITVSFPGAGSRCSLPSSPFLSPPFPRP